MPRLIYISFLMCVLEQDTYPLLSTGSNLTQHDLKSVDRDEEHQSIQTNLMCEHAGKLLRQCLSGREQELR